MSSYIFKRILLMIPTLLFVVLLEFVILNVMPGGPAQTRMGSKGAQSTQAQGTSESYKIFKEQFNLDKPVLFNTRFWLTRKDVSTRLETLADGRRPACPTGSQKQAPDNCLPAEKQPQSRALIDARQSLSDWGTYIVPELLEIAEQHDRLDVRILAVKRLASNAEGDLIRKHGEELTKKEEQYNDRVDAINDRIEKWTVPMDASEAELEKMLAKWRAWYHVHRYRFEYPTSKRAWAFFMDTRFAKYMTNLAHLDFGISHVNKKPVIETIGQKVRYTLAMSFAAIFLAFSISVPIGVWSANNQHTWIDQATTTILLMLYSLPSFFIAVLLLKFLAAGDPFRWFPIGGFVGDNPSQMTTLAYFKSVAWHLILPVFCLTYRRFAALSRYARTGVIDVIRSDYIRTARAKGLSESMVIIKHATRNGMIPILTLLGTRLPRLIGGSIVIEVVFGIPGMGSYLLQSILARDYNALMAILLISAVLTMIGILISDITYALVDPRISFD
ncbi:MAG: ABC transporter permease [Bradymonadaceae bacterium]